MGTVIVLDFVLTTGNKTCHAFTPELIIQSSRRLQYNDDQTKVYTRHTQTVQDDGGPIFAHTPFNPILTRRDRRRWKIFVVSHVVS